MMIRRHLRSILLSVFALSAVHATALWMQSSSITELNFTVPGGMSAEEVSSAGWQLSPAGLMIPDDFDADQPVALRIGVWKSRFHDLKLKVEPTTTGRGRVVARLIGDEVVEAQLSSPFPKPPEVAWHLILGRPGNQVDLSGLQQDGTANLDWPWPETTAGYIYLERTSGATGPLIRSAQVERTVAGWTYFWLPFLWLPVIAITMTIAEVSDHSWLRRLLALLVIVVLGLIVLVPVHLLEYGPLLVATVSLPALAFALHVRRFAMVPLWILCLLLAISAHTRFEAYQTARHQPLDPDAQGFLAIADQSTAFYDTQHREPLVIALVKLSTLIFGPTSTAVRAVSMTASLVLVLTLWWSGNQLFGPPAGLLAAALLATSDEWAGQAVRGLRLECFTIGLLILTVAIFGQSESGTRDRRSMMMATAAGIWICLLRMTSLWFVALALIYQGMKIRQWRWTAGSLLVLALAVVPFFVNSARSYGDPLHVVNHHIRFYRNQEFRDQPGFPTTEELKTNAYGGPPTSSFDYFFRMHSPLELMKRTVRQFYGIFAGPKLKGLTCGDHLFLYFWALAALAFCCLRRPVFVIWMAILIGPIAWLYSPVSEPEWRLIFHVSPFVYLCMSFAVVEWTKDHVPNTSAA